MNIEPIPNDFLVWYSGAPLVCMNVDLEFDLWYSGAPLEIIDESWNPERRKTDTF